MNALGRVATERAAHALSRGGAFFFSPRQLYYQLVRDGAWPAPSGSPRNARIEFRRALGAHLRKHGRVAGLVSARAARAAVPTESAPDLADYSVRRVLVVDRVETFLVLALNGFHRRVEVALLAWDRDGTAFPAPVARRLEAQLEAGLRTAFYTVHDACGRGVRLNGRVREALSAHGTPRVADVGLTFAQAFRLGVPVRTGGKPARIERLEPEEQLLHASGSYAHLEELPPLELLRWTYERVVRGPEELGFG
jgi:hypothetical protein